MGSEYDNEVAPGVLQADVEREGGSPLGIVQQLDYTDTIGFGVRVLVNGSWGFASSRELTKDEIDRVAEKLGLPKMPETSGAARSETLQHTIYKGLIAPIVLLGGLAVAAFRSTKKQPTDE